MVPRRMARRKGLAHRERLRRAQRAVTEAAIEHHAAIGDGRSVALVTRDGAIDWLCWPRFDSAAVFAGLLDAARGGSWWIRPTRAYQVARRYERDSNVLVTTFTTDRGRLRLIDFMPVAGADVHRRELMPEHEVLRIATCDRGEVELEVRFEPRPEYGRERARLRDRGALGWRLDRGSELYSLHSSHRLQGEDGAAGARIRLNDGERLVQSLVYAKDPAVLPVLDRADELLERTLTWWRAWADKCRYEGPYRAEVVRSLLVVKLLGYAPSGAIVAAPTTSLPERVGGDLNWDYRFCWVRDASFTVSALLGCGYDDEAEAFVSWLLYTTRLSQPHVATLYDVNGETRGTGLRELAHLGGWRGSRPVRIGNGAADQLQLDGYGELIDAVTQVLRGRAELDRSTRRMLRDLGTFVCDHWRLPDFGIWEVFWGAESFTHSKVLCWIALDRLLELHAQGKLDLPVERFRAERDALAQQIESEGFDEGVGSYVQAYGGVKADAALLLIGRYGYRHPTDERVRGTWRFVRERLLAGDGLLYRYEQSRSVHEGAFGCCGFWAAELLARGAGTLDEAVEWFEGSLRQANELGLMAEEWDPATGAQLGNFPQAYTHVGLISAALAIDERRKQEAR